MERLIFFYGKIVLPLLMSILCTASDVVVTVSNPIVERADTTLVAISSASMAHRIVFASDRDRCFYFDIYTMNADGSDVRRLTDNVADDKSPAWSPDGERIAFTSNRDGNWEIYAMKTDGAEVARLTNDPGFDWQPTWSPDGQRLAFTSDRDGRWEIYTMNPDGAEVKHLTNLPADGRDPAWSPDGQRIAFVSTRNRAWEIYLMNANGTNVMRMTQGTAINQSPSWSPDGKRIIYESNGEIMTLDVQTMYVANLSKNAAVDFQPSCSCTLK